MPVFDNPSFDGHLMVHAFFDPETGLKGFIAIHSTALGPAFGGCRRWDYPNEDAALSDALRLSRGMSYKNALAGIPFGGGKAVIIAGPDAPKSPRLFETFGNVVESLGGRYITAEDVGVSVTDMKDVARATRFVSGIAGGKGRAGGDPSPKTAMGVFLGIRVAAMRALRRNDLDGLRVAVQGAGHVGYHVCRLLAEAGARLRVADIDASNVERVCDEFGAEKVATDVIIAQNVDVLSPCALGGIINARTIPTIRARIIAGAANNQLGEIEDGDMLHRYGILYAPDYVINAGGIISVAAEYQGTLSDSQVDELVGRVEDRLLEIFERSEREGSAPARVADHMAQEIIAKAA
jgi:leucine dehydrogenase